MRKPLPPPPHCYAYRLSMPRVSTWHWRAMHRQLPRSKGAVEEAQRSHAHRNVISRLWRRSRGYLHVPATCNWARSSHGKALESDTCLPPQSPPVPPTHHPAAPVPTNPSQTPTRPKLTTLSQSFELKSDTVCVQRAHLSRCLAVRRVVGTMRRRGARDRRRAAAAFAASHRMRRGSHAIQCYRRRRPPPQALSAAERSHASTGAPAGSGLLESREITLIPRV